MFKQNFKGFYKILRVLKVQMVWGSRGDFPRQFKFQKVSEKWSGEVPSPDHLNL